MGHLVAHKVRNSLSRFLSSEENISLLVSTKWQACTERGHLDSTTTESSDDLVPLRNVFVDCYERMDNELRTQAQTDCEFSGTTAVTLLIQGRNLVIANVGDSRAILASRKADGLSLHVEQLTVDFKPDLPGELERIKNCKGRVFALEDEPEVARLWLPHENRPGLAMARALGDFCLKEYGLSAIPHVCFRRIDEDDEFVVLATDGVWDVMSNEEVANVVKNTESKGMAAKKVVDAAVKKWKRNFTHVRMDDCAVVCHFLNQKHSISVCYSDMSQSSSRLMNSELLHQESTTNTVAPCLDRGI
ncbi:hypothetical protein KP509_19G064800 [Ceratopteris richardii]|nr:hypothetical protein KP509_19G064800 [Ceratopteris richardii]